MHACPNDYIFYRKEFSKLHQCPHCGVSRYKQKYRHPLAKVLWYLLVVPWLKQLFSNANGAKIMRWHVDGRTKDDHLRHLVDGLQWKKIDSMFLNFSNESRNIRFGLATDGMNP